MSYIISNDNELIAKVRAGEQPPGLEVKYGFEKSKEAINAARDYNLVNARTGKISNAKKWDKVFAESECGFATEINPGEFLV